MNLGQLLSPSVTVICDQITSKKKILEKVSQLMAETIDTTEKRIFESLVCREKLGTTALGNGIAIPHGRIAACQQATVIFLLLTSPIEYDAPDGKPVDIIFALMVPTEAHNDHLRYLAQISKLLSDEALIAKLRHAYSNEALCELIMQATEHIG